MFVGSTKKELTNDKKNRISLWSISRRRSKRLQEKFATKMSRLDRQTISATESLLSAIRFFDVDTVENLLKSDLEIEYNCCEYHYPAMYDSDLEINYRKGNHGTVLHNAVRLIAADTTWKNYRSKEKSNEHLDLLYRPEALPRIVELLLESGRFNVNALTDSCDTALHYAVGSCMCKEFYCDAYQDLVNAIIELLLKNNANINTKTSKGETPLMKASQNGCSHIVQLLLDWSDELGAGVDLNARDIYGETALIKAAKYARADVVELLLKHGCFDEIQDYRGFYALHSVIYGSDTISNASSDFLALMGVLASEETPVVLNRCASLSMIENSISEKWTGNDSIQETVSLFVTHDHSKISSKDFGGHTVLDLALKSKLRISPKTVEKLKEYGAIFGSLLNKHQEYPNITLQYTNKLGKTPLHRLSAVLPKLTMGKKFEIFVHRLNSSHHKEEFEKMTVAKDLRGRTVLHYAVISLGTEEAVKWEDIFLLINVLKLKRTINKRDNYGRTPLHYCEDEDVYESLVKEGANKTIQDIDGKTPRDLQKLRNEEHKRYELSEEEIRLIELDFPDYEIHNEITKNPENSKTYHDAWMIWKESEYAYRDQFSKTICDQVRSFMNRLSDEITKRDPRLECWPVLIGSAEEGTKIGLPDEFDFNITLTKLSKVCEVVPSPEAPNGFVHLKRRQANQHFQSQDNFDSFFNSGGFLLTSDIAGRFRILYLQVMSEPEFWEGESFFEWDSHNEAGMHYSKFASRYKEPDSFNDIERSTYLYSTIQLKLNRPIEGRYMFRPISVDIVPCIKINGWWPEKALSDVNDEIKAGGCHLVFDRPQRHYPWVPFSVPFARISFAPAESRMIKECSAVARAAYMVGKQLLLNCYYKPKHTYVLKTCLLYCIEALKDCTRNSLLYEDINPPELRFFVDKLMLCFREFYLHDFFPCYMMPSFHLPFDDILKPRLLSCRYTSRTNELYRRVCTAGCPVDFCFPTPEPLMEKFNREELMRILSMDRTNLQQKSFAAGQMVRCDSQIRSQVSLSTKRKRRQQTKDQNVKQQLTETKIMM